MKQFLIFLLVYCQLFTGIPAFAEQRIITADIIEGQDTVKNFLGNKGHFEKNVNAIIAYADAAGTRPVDGTAGSPTLTCTRTTSSPLAGDGSLLITKDAANRQGNGCAVAFTIDSSQKARVLQIEFDYIVGSGTFAAGSSSTDSDIIVDVYDVTNSRIIEPSSIKFLSSSSTNADKFITNFQSSPDSTSYRLIFHVASTSASAYTVKVDDLKVTPSRYVYGTPITDWQSYSPVLRGGTNGSTFTNQTTTGKWRRVGDTIDLDIYTTFTGTPGTGTGDFRWTLPSGLVADTTKMTATGNNQAIGSMSYTDSGTNFKMVAIPQLSSTTEIGAMADGASASAVNLTSPITWTTNDNIKIVAQVPITGWSSSVQVSDGFDARQIGFRANNSSTTINSTPAKIVWTNTDKDDVAGYSSGTYTVRSAGWYDVSASLYIGGTPSVDQTSQVAIYRNGAAIKNFTYRYKVALATTTSIGPVADSFYFNAGDTIEIYGSSELTTPTISSSTTLNTVFIGKRQSPQTVSATEKVAFMAEGASSSALGTNTVIPFNTPSEDTHSRWDSTNKDYAVPYPGTYKVTCAARATFAGASVNQYFDVLIQVDTVTKREFVKYLENTGVAAISGIASYQARLTAGQKIRCLGDTNLTAGTLTTGATHTYLEIALIK